MRRRTVRVAESFFDLLDELLPADRAADGTPSTTDFLLHAMPPLIEALARDFEGSTQPVMGRDDVRVLIADGYLFPVVSVYAAVRDDDSIDIVFLEIDQG